MCDHCAYNQDGYCYAPNTWWQYNTDDGVCALFIDREKEDNQNAAE